MTIALVVYGLAINVIPFIIGAPLIGVYCLTAFTFAVVLYVNRSEGGFYEERVERIANFK